MWMVLVFLGGFSQSRSPLDPSVWLILKGFKVVGALSSAACFSNIISSSLFQLRKRNYERRLRTCWASLLPLGQIACDVHHTGSVSTDVWLQILLLCVCSFDHHVNWSVLMVHIPHKFLDSQGLWLKKKTAHSIVHFWHFNGFHTKFGPKKFWSRRRHWCNWGGPTHLLRIKKSHVMLCYVL